MIIWAAALVGLAIIAIWSNWSNRKLAKANAKLVFDLQEYKTYKELYESAMSRDLWKGTPAVHDHVEYWAMGVLTYFDATGGNAPPNDADYPITKREMLKEYDPGLFALVEETMAYKGKVDWRYGE